ncbi:MFS transporter [Alkalihalophilus sp. As8PL]|uniref:MFS transporter n=1 Tax=Alkalihalophilus sp. As8PL TaxID=3237103 RepID=A0AB39BV09_9BACI
MNQISARPSILLLVVGLLPIVMVLGNSMFIPILPFMQVELGITTAQAGLILTIFSIPSALFIPVSGVLSDAYGRRKVVMASLVVVMIGCILSAFGAVYQLFGWVLVGRFIQGIGAGGVTPIAMVLAADLFSSEKRNQALASIESFNGIGKVVSPIIGGLILMGVWYYSFVVYFAVVLFAYIGFYLFIPKTKRANVKRERAPLKESVALLKKERETLLPIFTASGVGMFLLFGFLFLLSYEWEQGVDSNGLVKGFILATPLLVLTVTSLVVGKYGLKNSDQTKRSIIWGLLFVTGSVAGFIFSSLFIADLLLISMLALGLGFLLPGCSACVALVVTPQVKGMVFSIYSMIRFLGVACGPYFFGLWMVDREQLVFNVLLLAGLTCVVLLWNWTCLPIGKRCEIHQTS